MVENTNKQDVCARHSQDEEVLLQQVRMGGLAGDHARETLLQLYYPRIQARCMQMLKSPADALDAKQEAALKVYRFLPDFEGRSSLQTWVYAITSRECINVLNNRSRTSADGESAEAGAFHDESPGCEQAMIEQEQTNLVVSVIDRLTPKAKDVLRMRFYGDMTLEEISMVSNLSLSATKMRLYRAMEQFQKIYGIRA